MLSSQAHTAETLAGISGLIHPTYHRRRRQEKRAASWMSKASTKRQANLALRGIGARVRGATRRDERQR